MILGLAVALSSPVYGGWKEKMTRNQIKAANYILKLKAGADPDKLPPPTIRRDGKARSSAATREVREAIEKAQEYARSGRHDRITTPRFEHKLVSDQRYIEIRKEFDKKP